MFDIGWQEIIILMVIALIIVGPKDLPRVVRTAGQWMGKARGYARDFQRTLDEAADATEINAVKKEIDEANRELSVARRDVAEGAGDMNKMFSDDVMKSSSTGKNPNGEAKPADAAASGPSTSETKPATAQASSGDGKGSGAGASPGSGASA